MSRATRILQQIRDARRLKEQLQAIREERLRERRQASESSGDVVWAPNPGPQTQFFDSECREVLYGGAAGGGKSAALIALPLKWAHLPGFLALTLRRESTQLKDLLSKAEELYPRIVPGIRFALKNGRQQYRCPRGAALLYGHCKEKNDYAQYDGWEINLLCFDELTHFTREQYVKICARVRSSKPSLPTLIRATTNPGGEGHDWVFRHWGAWLDNDFEAHGLPPKDLRPHGPPAKPGEVWWIRTLRDGSEEYFRTDPGPQPGKPKALSRTFIPAKLSDNPKLAENDPAYVAQLNMLDAVRRAQLQDGDWLVKPAAGLYFKRSWVKRVPVSDVPRDAKFCRGWDRAATEKNDSNDPDFTVGVLLARKDGVTWVVDRKKGQWGPGVVESLIIETAKTDAQFWSKGTLVSLPQDPGQAGKDQKFRMLDKLSAHPVRMRPESGDKITRFAPFSSQCEQGKDLGTVRFVEADWTEDYLSSLEGFDGQGKVHDDDADATSTAHAGLNSKLLNQSEDTGTAGSARGPERLV